MYTKEKSGILRAERLRDALYDVGFQLGSDVMAIVMLRYMRKDGTVRMGDFASAILHLTTAFEVFQKKDHDQDNVVKIEMVDVSILLAIWMRKGICLNSCVFFFSHSGSSRCCAVRPETPIKCVNI